MVLEFFESQTVGVWFLVIRKKGDGFLKSKRLVFGFQNPTVGVEFS
jgi:hypothetical protein